MIYAALRWFMRAMTRTYLIGLFHIAGAENVPRTGPIIVCPSHSGTLDPPMVPAFTPRGDSWSMAKSEYFKGGIVEMLFRWYHAFPVVRHTADRAALKLSFDLLKAGHALIIYPEGTRVESGVLANPEVLQLRMKLPETTCAAVIWSVRSGDTLEHQRLQRAHALLLQQRHVGKANAEAALEFVHQPDLRQRVPLLDRRRPVVVADLDSPAEDVFEHGPEGLLERPVVTHCSSEI